MFNQAKRKRIKRLSVTNDCFGQLEVVCGADNAEREIISSLKQKHKRSHATDSTYDSPEEKRR